MLVLVLLSCGLIKFAKHEHTVNYSEQVDNNLKSSYRRRQRHDERREFLSYWMRELLIFTCSLYVMLTLSF